MVCDIILMFVARQHKTYINGDLGHKAPIEVNK